MYLQNFQEIYSSLYMSDFTSMLKISVGRDYFRTLYLKSLCLFEVWCSVVQSFAKIKFSSFIFQKYFDFLQPPGTDTRKVEKIFQNYFEF